MDIYEETAQALEDAQVSRFKKFLRDSFGYKSEDEFWENNHEGEIFESIKSLRAQSETFHPHNLR